MNRPLSVTITSIVALLQGIALLVVAAVYVFNLVTGAPVESLPVALFLVVLFVLFGIWLAAIGHFLFRGYRWPRSGALIAQLFVVCIGVPALTGGQVLLGLVIVIPAVVAAIFVFDPKAVAFGQLRADSSTNTEAEPNPER